MNEASNINKSTSNKIWKRLFFGVLGIQAIMELAIAGAVLFNFPVALESGFGITYSSELEILGVALGLYLLLLTSLLILSIVWTYQKKYEGITIGIIVGIFLVIFGVVSFLKFGDFQPILVDSLRGVVTIFLAYMAGKEFKV